MSSTPLGYKLPGIPITPLKAPLSRRLGATTRTTGCYDMALGDGHNRLRWSFAISPNMFQCKTSDPSLTSIVWARDRALFRRTRTTSQWIFAHVWLGEELHHLNSIRGIAN